jgi:hypothetical protein
MKRSVEQASARTSFGAIGVVLYASTAYAQQQQISNNYTLAPGSFTDLGFAPTTVQVSSGTPYVVIADTTPAAGTTGVQIGSTGASGPPIVISAADASSHVFASAVGAAAVITSTPNINPLLRWRTQCRCFAINP